MIYRSLISDEPNIQNNLMQIGSSALKSENIPLNSNYNYSWSGFIYKSDEINNVNIVGNDEKSKVLTGIDVYHANITSPNLSNQNIYLGHIDEFFFNNVPQVNLSDLNVSNLTLCKSLFTTSFRNNKWVTYNFDTNFIYNGTKNLLLIWENKSGVISGSSSSYFTFAEKSAAYAISNSEFPNGDAIRTNERINIKLRF